MNAAPYSILHLSDLHRHAGSSLSNEELISSLLQDRDRYMKGTTPIEAPSAIVVSGDIIQGVGLGEEGFPKEIRCQYDFAEELLDKLARNFLEGDRSRLVMVPGNHDVDWNMAFQAMEPVTKNKIPLELETALHEEDSDYRWDWRTQTLFRIVNPERYEKRMDAYWSFFERFYRDVPASSVKKLDRDVCLFSLYGGRIGVVAYNSCHRNDCFAYHGMIDHRAIARSHMTLRNSDTFELYMAVWHHNIEGPPYRVDYMNINTVRTMIGLGFRLGLYGHQHKAQANPCEIRLPDKESMAAISAGSLCAADNELPQNVSRQYNILEISSDLCEVRIHVREMNAAKLFAKAYLPQFGGNSYVKLPLTSHRNPAGTSINTQDKRRGALISTAEKEISDGKPEKATELLRGLSLLPGSYERALFLRAAAEIEDWDSIIQVTDTPATLDELLLLYNAFFASSDFQAALKILDRFSHELKLPKDVEDNLRGRIRAWRFVRS